MSAICWGPRCRVQLVVPASTKMSSADHKNFDVPTKVANRKFKSVNHLLQEIVTIRDMYSHSNDRLSSAHQELMTAVFQFHPEAKRKLKGMQFIKVGPNTKSNRPNDSSFYIMTSEEDGDDISYMKCLRRLSELAVQEAPGEHVVPLAAVTSKYEGLAVQIGEADLLVETDTPAVFGVHVELNRKLLSVRTKSRMYGPWILNHSSGVRLLVVVDTARDRVTISWKAPFQVLHASPVSQKVQGEAPSLAVCLDVLARRAGLEGAFAASAEEELELAAGQVLVKTFSASTQLACSRAGAAAQIQSLHSLAKHQAYDFLRAELCNSQARLQEAIGEGEIARSVLDKLRDELDVLRRRIFPPQATEVEQNVQDTAGTGPSADWNLGSNVDASEHGAGDASIKALSLRLREHLPEPAATMLRNSLSLMSSELYSGPSRALWELVQNADDCKFTEAPHMKIVEDPNYLWLEYNEAGFTLQDVEALCSLGISMKGPGQTGHKGVGFKASFVLSSCPHVISNPYRLLSRDRQHFRVSLQLQLCSLSDALTCLCLRFFFSDEADCILPHVTPQVLPADASFPRELPSNGTAIYLPLRKPVPNLLREVASALANPCTDQTHIADREPGERTEVPSTLLFLRKLQSLSLYSAGGHAHTYEWKGLDEGLVEVMEHSDKPQKHEYFVARGLNRSIAIAFPLSGSTFDASPISTTLPLCTLPGLKTPLDAPFELTANREALLEGSAKNASLRDALAQLWLEAVEGAIEGSTLAARAWSLQPGPELAQLTFWSPFLHRVRSGLQEMCLVPVLAGRS